MPVRQRGVAVVDAGRCTGCGWCVAACDLHLLVLHTQAAGPAAGRKISFLPNPRDCTGCRLCERRCPFGAIRVQRSEQEA